METYLIAIMGGYKNMITRSWVDGNVVYNFIIYKYRSAHAYLNLKLEQVLKAYNFQGVENLREKENKKNRNKL